MKDLIETASDILWINELFDKPHRWEKTFDAEDLVKYKFKTSDGKIAIVTMGADPDSDEWDVVFTKNFSYDATGEGDQFRIFATVIDCIKDFVVNKKPAEFVFLASSDEKKSDDPTSRQKLYDRMVKRFGGQIKYRLKIDTNSNGDRRYTFTKK